MKKKKKTRTTYCQSRYQTKSVLSFVNLSKANYKNRSLNKLDIHTVVEFEQ